jgi:hypothetical protein
VIAARYSLVADLQDAEPVSYVSTPVVESRVMDIAWLPRAGCRIVSA